jgi:hypothetical protein
MTKEKFIEEFNKNGFKYDKTNHVIDMGDELYCHIGTAYDPFDKGDVLSFFIYSNKTGEGEEITYRLSTEAIECGKINAELKDRDIYIGLYAILTWLETITHESFELCHIYKYGWLLDFAMFGAPKKR